MIFFKLIYSFYLNSNYLLIDLSHTGKRLMAKCRKLLQENEELGKIVSSGNIASLETDIAYHKRLLTEITENEQSKHFFL